jgi:hypothetical protein
MKASFTFTALFLAASPAIAAIASPVVVNGVISGAAPQPRGLEERTKQEDDQRKQDDEDRRKSSLRTDLE